jgi:hypothetical protein
MKAEDVKTFPSARPKVAAMYSSVSICMFVVRLARGFGSGLFPAQKTPSYMFTAIFFTLALALIAYAWRWESRNIRTPWRPS